MSKIETKTKQLDRERLYTLIKSPVLTEKSNAGSEQNKFTLNVLLDATKVEIKQAVEEIFKVKVKAINTIRVKGKVKRFKGILGQRNERKKAIVTLAAGSSIDIASGL
jgi:large subunit ribosomal protein L23